METMIVAAVVLAIVMIGVGIASKRDITVCHLEVEGGKLRIVSGSLAAKVRGDIEDIVGRPPVKRAGIRILRAGSRARCEFEGHGLSDAQKQRLRNVVGTTPLARLAGEAGGSRVPHAKK